MFSRKMLKLNLSSTCRIHFLNHEVHKRERRQGIKKKETETSTADCSVQFY